MVLRPLSIAAALVLVLAFSIQSGSAQEPPAIAGECLIVVKGKTEKDGACRIMLFPGGGFQTGGAKRGEAFAIVNIDAEHRGTAYWNGTEHASHAQEDLGAVKRDGGCWFNDTSRICAWRPGTRPR